MEWGALQHRELRDIDVDTDADQGVDTDIDSANVCVSSVTVPHLPVSSFTDTPFVIFYYKT